LNGDGVKERMDSWRNLGEAGVEMTEDEIRQHFDILGNYTWSTVEKNMEELTAKETASLRKKMVMLVTVAAKVPPAYSKKAEDTCRVEKLRELGFSGAHLTFLRKITRLHREFGEQVFFCNLTWSLLNKCTDKVLDRAIKMVNGAGAGSGGS
jgi:hypothetical protein